jgi:two-component system, OmpR family, alkaline phosphatase synthesis response regulator PhoP
VESKKYKILFADANEESYEETRKILEKADLNVVGVKAGKELIITAKKEYPDLILLDVDLDDLDGIEVCWEIKANAGFYRTPIIFYSERFEDFTQIAAFEAGAEDFIKKPARHRLLIARINAVLKRCYEMDENVKNVRKFGSLEIDEEQVMIYKKGEALKLSKKEFQIILLLTSKPGKVFRRNNILEKIWGDEIIVGDRNIDSHIKKLRKKIGKEYIQTFRGIGYTFKMP